MSSKSKGKKTGRRNKPEDRVFRSGMAKKREQNALDDAYILVTSGYERLPWMLQETAQQLRVPILRRRTKTEWWSPERLRVDFELWVLSSDLAAIKTAETLAKEDQLALWKRNFKAYDGLLSRLEYSQTEVRIWAMMNATRKP